MATMRLSKFCQHLLIFLVINAYFMVALP